jgi:hypothetical protein
MMPGDEEATGEAGPAKASANRRVFKGLGVQAVAKGVERFILELRRGRFQVRATVAANLALGEAKNDKVSRGAVN